MSGSVNIALADALLKTSLALLVLTSDPRKWSKKKLKDNQPRYLRFQQIQILLRVLDLHVDAARFMEGEFLLARGYEESLALVDKIRDMMRISKKTFACKYYNRLREKDYSPQYWLQSVFEMLLNYRIKADLPLQIWSTWLIVDAPLLLCMDLTGKVNDRLQKSLQQVEKILTLIIDPTLREMSLVELAEKHGYPSLGNVDFEWL